MTAASSFNKLREVPDDRTIVWVYDAKGGAGKSRLTRHLIRNYGAIVLSGQFKDMALMYDKQRVVIFDVCRADQEYLQAIYKIMEALKNGFLISNKYESEFKIFDPPHVMVMANILPDTQKISADRIVLFNLRLWSTLEVAERHDQQVCSPVETAAQYCPVEDEEGSISQCSAHQQWSL